MRSLTRQVLFIAGNLLLLVALAGCATTSGSDLQRRQTTDCPNGLMLVCEGRGEPSRGGAEEEIPQYDRCVCRVANY